MQQQLTREQREQQQRAAALRRANKIRLARAKIRHEVRDGKRDLASVIREAPEPVENLPIAEVLAFQRHVRAVGAEQMLDGVIHPTIPLRRIGTATRERIIQRATR